MNSLLLQINVPGKIKEKQGFLDYAPTIYSISNDNVKKYADKIGADYKLITDCDYMPDYHPTWQRFAIFHSDFDKYDTIIYMDSDYVTHDMTPNVLEIIKDKSDDFFAVIDKVGMKYLKEPGDGFYFNAGFFVIRRPLIDKLKPIYLDYCKRFKNSNFVDQDCLNAMRLDHFKEFGKLSHHWNGILAIKRPLFATHYCALRKRDFQSKDYYRHETYKLNTLTSMSQSEIEDEYWEKEY